MTYVPDYVRPVGPKTPPSLPSVSTNSKHNRRSALIVSIPKPMPSNSLQEKTSLEKTSSRRRSSSNPTYAPSRFVKAPQERICSRVSIKERLQSLEVEAAVKLKVRSTSQRPKRRSVSHGASISPQVIANEEWLEENSREQPFLPTVGKNEDQPANDGENMPSMPKPDIIASNQPKSTAPSDESNTKNHVKASKARAYDKNKESIDEQDQSVQERNDASLQCRKSTDSFEERNQLNESKYKLDDSPCVTDKRFTPQDYLGNTQSGDFLLENDAKDMKPECSKSYCIIDSIYNSHKGDTPNLADKIPNNDTSSPSVAEVKLCESERTDGLIARPQQNNISNSTIVKEKSSASSNFKPIWRTPSFKQVQRPDEEYLPSVNDRKEANFMNVPTSLKSAENEVKQMSGAVIALDESQDSSNKQTSEKPTIQTEENNGSASIQTHTNTVNTQANTASYPVELRSPRHERSGQVLRRQSARDKRNARVFIMPSSSDSDMDNNPISRMDRDFAKLGLARAVDLLPNQNQNPPCHLSENNHPLKIPDSQVKHVTPVKFVPYVLKSNYVESKSAEKKDSMVDESSKLYPELLTPSRSSIRDPYSHNGQSKKDTQRSPNRRRKSTHSDRTGRNRSKSTDARRIDYNVQRHRSNSMCEPKTTQHRQKEVANAVISGMTPDSTIPYIDDITTPPDNGTAEGDHAHRHGLHLSDGGRKQVVGNVQSPIHRSNSADVLSSLAREESPAKMRKARALSADRTIAKGVHRRSYQIATMSLDVALDKGPSYQSNIEKLNKYLLDTSLEADKSNESNFGGRDQVSRSGYLHFKVATIDKGKRTSSQKSWKLVWAMLKDQQLYLSREWNKTKNGQDIPVARQLSLQEEVQPLNIQSSLVGIAYNYLKRRNVFKITTFNGSEYLFQAENRDDMLAWISAIEKVSWWEDGAEAINEDLILRKTNQIEAGPKSDKRLNKKRSPKPSQKSNLQVKDVDGSRRFKWRGSVNRIVKKFGTGQPFVLSGTFGVHLEDCPPSPLNEFVPFIVEMCCSIVEERGLHFTGIYRVPGNNAALLALQEDLNNHGIESTSPDDERLRDLNIVSSLLKSFFRKLPEPLFTNELYHDFIQANRQLTPEKRLNNLRRLVHMLPGPHYETLKFLICHLRNVADNCDANKMEVRNLAIVFGPTLVRNTAGDDTATMVTDMSDQCRIIESIIDRAEWFFSGTHTPASETLNATVLAEKEYEAVPSIDFLLDNVGRKPGDTGNTSESTKSKGSEDSEKDSFSRDLMDLLFGKKWKQSSLANNQVAEDDGGFEEYRIRKHDDAPRKKEEATSDIVVSDNPNPVGTLQSESIPNVSERLMNFYREHLERLSQTPITQTFPPFSSADSSPHTTPRNSTVFNAPHAFPLADVAARPNRSRVNSDTNEAGHTALSNKGNSAITEPHGKSAPQYKHPPNPYERAANTLASSGHHWVPSGSSGRPLRNDIPVVIANTNVTNVLLPKTSLQSYGRSETVPYMDDNVQLAPQNGLTGTEVLMDENNLSNYRKNLPSSNLVNVKSGTSSSMPKSGDVSNIDTKSPPRIVPLNKTDQTMVLPQYGAERRKSQSKENFSVPLAVGSSSEKMFNRYDPKRRGIRFIGPENDEMHFLGNISNISLVNKQSTDKERFFKGQSLHKKLSTRKNQKQRVARRHTLSGIQDIQEHAPSLKNKKFMSNLQQATTGWNLSMYDLAYTSTQSRRSAMERLKPKCSAPGMTLSNWIAQERLRSKTVPHDICTTGNSVVIAKRKGSKSHVLSYV